MNDFEGPLALSEAVTQNWEEVVGLPTRERIRAIIFKLYRLSLTVDEGRYPRLLFVRRGNNFVDPMFIPLGTVPLFLADIVSFAPAIAPPPFALVLRGENDHCHGIMNLERAGKVPGAYFGIRRPGEIEVTTYRAGHGKKSWILSRDSCQAVRDLLSSTIFIRICERAAKSTGYSKDNIMELLRHLAYTISKRGHGGALLFRQRGCSDAATKPRIDFGNECCPLVLSNQVSVEPLMERANVISFLSQIDGAVVFDEKLQICGAGVFLSQEETKVWPENGPFAGKEADMRVFGLGSRHRSAAWFCKRNEGACAIVISQDGAIRVLAHNEGKVGLEGPYLDRMIPI